MKNECFVEVGSMTQAMKARGVLAASAIPSEVIKTEAHAKRGCAYGLSVSCTHLQNAITALKKARITPRHVEGGE